MNDNFENRYGQEYKNKIEMFNTLVSEMETTAANKPKIKVKSLSGGRAYSIRFDGRNAVPAFNRDGIKSLPNDNDDPLKMQILGVKGFAATGLWAKQADEKKTKNWIEIFYLDYKNRFCVTPFHGESAERFIKSYEGATFDLDKDVEVGFIAFSCEVRTVNKVSKNNEAYKVAEFRLFLDSDELIEAKIEARKKLQMFRTDTLNASVIDKVFFVDGCLILGQDGELTANIGLQHVKQLPASE